MNSTDDVVIQNSPGGTSTVMTTVDCTLGGIMSYMTLIGSGGIVGTANSGRNGTYTDSTTNGDNTFVAAAGVDKFVLESAGVYNNIDVINNFEISGNDKIDIKALMSAARYSHGVSTLSDFVQAVTNGSGGTYGFQSVADITGVSVNVSSWPVEGIS